MGRKKQNPRYNVLSFRVDDYELRALNEQISSNRQEYLRQAVMNQIIRDRQDSLDQFLRVNP